MEAADNARYTWRSGTRSAMCAASQLYLHVNQNSDDDDDDDILKSSHWPRGRCPSKVFLFLVLVAILFSGAEPF